MGTESCAAVDAISTLKALCSAAPGLPDECRATLGIRQNSAWSRDPPHPSALVVVDRLADFLFRPVFAGVPDRVHEGMMSDPAHAPGNRPHDSPPVAVFQGL